MQGNTEFELDQLWFTWSTSGLGSMPMGFRVRAASEGLYDTQSIRYRRLNRFLSYKLPEGTNISEFNKRIAPVSLSFIDNGDERLLIRKVFIGQDAVGRNGVFFTHLIAGLPREFTARDAIRLWNCPTLWVESEPENKAPNDTFLQKIHYSDLYAHVIHSQTTFNLAPISEQLQDLLLLILCQGLPQRIIVRGQSIFIASLIYGLTHTLPMTLLPRLTFTTYESEIQGDEFIIMGTISGVELQNATGLQVQPTLPMGQGWTDVQRYVVTAVNSLIDGNTDKLYKVIDEIERHDQATTDDLIGLFKRRFRIDPLTTKQLEDIILHPADNLDDLFDPSVQQEAAQLLLTRPDYWEQCGREVFSKVTSWLVPGAQTRLDQQTRDTLAKFLNGIAQYVFASMQTELMQGVLPKHTTALLNILATPLRYSAIYRRMLSEFAQEPLYNQIASEELWSFQRWLLQCAKLIEPRPTQEQMLPWLNIHGWEKLDKVLKLDLPAEWEYQATYGLLNLNLNRDIPKKAVAVVKAHETKIKAYMQNLLQQGSLPGKQDYINAVLHLFEGIIHYEEQDGRYPNRAALLLELLNAVPNNPRVIELLFSIVPFASPYQLTADEFDNVVARCRPEVIAVGGASPSLMAYLQEYILSLMPKKLANENTLNLLMQFQRTSSTLPDRLAYLVNYWLAINQFLASSSFNRELLQAVKPALESLIPLLQQRQSELAQGGQDIRQMFLQEIVPHLVTLINTEHQLESVLEVFKDAQVCPWWDLLSAMADRAGAVYAQDLSRLTPYLLCGIRECELDGLGQEALDSYLQALYGRVSENALSNVDKAASLEVWPELIQSEWAGWRKRTKHSWVSSIPVVGKKISPQSQRPPTVPHPGQATKASQENSPAIWQPGQAGFSMQQPIILSPLLGQVNAPDPVIATATLSNQAYPLLFSHYQQLHLAFTQVLPYWAQVLSEKLDNSRKGIEFEVSITRALLEELQGIPVTRISDKLIQYFADGILIDSEIKRLLKSGNQAAKQFFDPNTYIVGHLDRFKAFVGGSAYQNFYLKHEIALKEALYRLILRYQFVKYMDSNKKDWEKWIGKERKHITTEYPSIQILP